MKNSNIVTILTAMLLILILRSCNVIETISRKSMGIGALAFLLVIIIVIIAGAFKK